jgi:predicted O-linked N-acetylglucosamine transferase (SPINDLY family)
LPREGFVFCCFSNKAKITPAIFDRWMRLLARVEGSVLWLVATSPTATTNLREESSRRGIDPARLVFAPRVPIDQHLARARLADLFLDTQPYNGHATTSDSLLAGLPVVTWLGDSFAGRVSASLLDAVGLPDLVAADPDAYEELALRLARDPAALAAIRARLGANRSTHALFDPRRFVRHLERLYERMLDRHAAGLPPGHLRPED